MSELCRRYGVSRAGYYAWKRRTASPHLEQDRWLYTRIVAIHAASVALPQEKCYRAGALPHLRCYP